MVHNANGIGALVLRLIVGLALLGWPRVGAAQGTWSVIATSGQALGQVTNPAGLAVDGAGNLYVAEAYPNARIQRRDSQGNWSILATSGSALGQTNKPWALAVDTAGNLYVADPSVAIHKRDTQGNWSVIGGPYREPTALAVDAAGDLYVADSHDWIHKRDAQGNWSLIAIPAVGFIGPLHDPTAEILSSVVD